MNVASAGKLPADIGKHAVAEAQAAYFVPFDKPADRLADAVRAEPGS
jgi:hypothetical protein